MKFKCKNGEICQIKFICIIMTILLSSLLFITIKEYLQFLHNEQYLLIIPTFLYLAFFSLIFCFTNPHRIRFTLTASNLMLITSVALICYLAYFYFAVKLEVLENRWLCPSTVPCLYLSSIVAIYMLVLLLMSGPIAFIRYQSKNYHSKICQNGFIDGGVQSNENIQNKYTII
jgi:hypothetical protein